MYCTVIIMGICLILCVYIVLAYHAFLFYFLHVCLYGLDFSLCGCYG